MSMATMANSPPVTSGGGPWAVETHGLTKRFGDNVAVDDVELLVPRGCRLRLPRARTAPARPR